MLPTSYTSFMPKHAERIMRAKRRQAETESLTGTGRAVSVQRTIRYCWFCAESCAPNRYHAAKVGIHVRFDSAIPGAAPTAAVC
jgi:hypothetical protein